VAKKPRENNEIRCARKNKYRFYSDRRAIARHARACTGLHSNLKISWNGRKRMELFAIEVDSRSSAPRRRSKRPRSKDRPERPRRVRLLANPVVTEVSCSSPVPHQPADGPAGVAPAHGTVGDRRGRTTPNESTTPNQTPTNRSPNPFPYYAFMLFFSILVGVRRNGRQQARCPKHMLTV
jgi:hypothetical protein